MNILRHFVSCGTYAKGSIALSGVIEALAKRKDAIPPLILQLSLAIAMYKGREWEQCFQVATNLVRSLSRDPSNENWFVESEAWYILGKLYMQYGFHVDMQSNEWAFLAEKCLQNAIKVSNGKHWRAMVKLGDYHLLFTSSHALSSLSTITAEVTVASKLCLQEFGNVMEYQRLKFKALRCRLAISQKQDMTVLLGADPRLAWYGVILQVKITKSMEMDKLLNEMDRNIEFRNKMKNGTCLMRLRVLCWILLRTPDFNRASKVCDDILKRCPTCDEQTRFDKKQAIYHGKHPITEAFHRNRVLAVQENVDIYTLSSSNSFDDHFFKVNIKN